MSKIFKFLALAYCICTPVLLPAQDAVLPSENDYYEMVTLPIPEQINLEVGGMTVMPDGRLAVSSRRGEVWMIENPYMEGNAPPHFRRFAHGLHEALGLAYRDGALYTTQRAELTRLVDTDGDARADRYETVYSWPLDGNYHEYSYGPLFRDNGNMLVTLNLAWVGHGASLSKWRGWMLEITPDGEMTPVATGMRSPAGMGMNLEGDVFYAENQGDWVGSGFITHVETGDFFGNPAGLRWTDEPGSPLDLKPEDIPDTGEPKHEVAKRVPGLKPATVWFPHTLMGISTSDILVDDTEGGFGPFAGQLFVGDQGHSRIMRVFLEKVNGVYQGICFPFREGFQSGVLRMVWGSDRSMFVGMTNRGWSSTGRDPFGIQRLVWTGKMPFEIKAVRIQPDGFELEFTQPVDREVAQNPDVYDISSFNYKYHHNYGSPIINLEDHFVQGVKLSGDGLKARIVVDGLREGYIHELKLSDLRNADGLPLLHDTGYYTLNQIPTGSTLALSELSTTRSVEAAQASTDEQPVASVQPKRLTEMPASWNGTPDVTLTIGTEPGLRFDKTEFEVRAGSKVQLVFNNDDDMMHNLVVVEPGTADDVAQAAIELGLAGQNMDFVPESDQVLFHTALLQPETSEAIYFTVPDTPDTYTFVCTFPGHARSMRGVIRVI